MLGIKIDFEKRIFGFDLLRAFAIFCVVHGHGRYLLNGTILEGFPWVALPRGVNIFFVLSGFLIGYSFIVNANKTGGKLTIDKSLNFWKRSVLRILPNYYLMLLVNYFLVRADILNGSLEQFSLWQFATFTQNLYKPFYNFFWESWSLATQEWFYFSFPVLLFFIGKKLSLKTTVLFISILFIAVSIFYRISINTHEYDPFWWDVSFRKVALSRFDCIFFGVIAAWLRFYYKTLWKKYAVHAFLIGIAAFFIAKYMPKEPNSVFTNVFYLSLAPVYISLWFPLIDKLKDTHSVAGKLISVVSVLSYAMYLLNLLLMQIIQKHFSDVLANYATLKYLLYWALVLLLSYMLYMLYENPISTYGNRAWHTTKMMYKRMGNRQ